VKSFDASKKHPVKLTFLLDEEVTPQLFAQKIARACARGALRPGEAILVEHAKIAIVVSEERALTEERIQTTDAQLLSLLPSFGLQWQSLRKVPKRTKFTQTGCRWR
jgi:hypothetical protein